MIDLYFLSVYNCHKNLVWHARSQPGSKFHNNISLYCKKVTCSSLKVWVKERTGQEFHHTRKMLMVGGGHHLVVCRSPGLVMNCGKRQS